MRFTKRHIGYFITAALVGILLAQAVFADNTPQHVQNSKAAFFNSAKELCGFKVLELEAQTLGTLQEGEVALYERLTSEAISRKASCYGWLGELLNSEYASNNEFNDPRFESMYPKEQ